MFVVARRFMFGRYRTYILLSVGEGVCVLTFYRIIIIIVMEQKCTSTSFG